MTKLKELSPDRCLQLREGGILKFIVQHLHEHTYEAENQSEANFNLRSFLSNFNRKLKKRQRLSQLFRAIVRNTAKDSELEIFDSLEAVRAHTEQLYRFASDSTEFNETPIPPHKVFDTLNELISADNTKNRPIVELFGGAFVILDYLRASMRMEDSDSVRIVRSQHPQVFQILNIMLKYPKPSRHSYNREPVRSYLEKCQSLHEYVVTIIKDAYESNDLALVRICCQFIYQVVIYGASYMRDTVLKFLTKLFPRIMEPETLYSVLEALARILDIFPRSILDFCSIEGSVESLIDVLMNVEHKRSKHNDVENAELYKKIRRKSVIILCKMNSFLVYKYEKEQLLNIFESRDIIGMLLDYLKLIAQREYSRRLEGPTFTIILFLRQILGYSENARKKFSEIVDAKKTVKLFEFYYDNNHLIVQLVREIMKLY